MKAAEGTKTVPMHTFSGPVEHAIAHIEEAAVHNLPEEQQRWYAIKIFERDDKVLEKLKHSRRCHDAISTPDIKAAEKELDDDAESIITNERYVYIAAAYQELLQEEESAGSFPPPIRSTRSSPTAGWVCRSSQLVMFLVYYISMVTVGSAATDWANDGLFGDGWHLFGIGSSDYTRGGR